MTGASIEVRRPIRPLTWIALAVSVLVAVIAWWTFFGELFDVFYTLPAELQFGWNIFLTVVGAAIGVALDAWAGSRGGWNRVISVVAGVVMISPLVAIVLWNIDYVAQN